MSVDHLLNKTVQQSRPDFTATGAGGDTETFELFNASLKIRLHAASASERIRSDREDAEITHVAYVLPATDIRRNDHLQDEDDRFRVLGVLPPSKAHHIKVVMTQISTPGDAPEARRTRDGRARRTTDRRVRGQDLP